jgi:polysaccharide pyruvyl transferase WcaK-like protein
VILGFSWSDESSTGARHAIRRASRKATLYPRDSLSMRRLVSLKVENVALSADIVFLLDTVDPVVQIERWLSVQEKAGKNIAVINISGLIAARVDQIPEYTEIVEYLESREFAVCFLPHVIRTGDNDKEEQDRLEAALPASNSRYFVRTRLSPSQVRFIAGAASIVITGRMHLAVMAMSLATPAITLGTQGKVEGLYAHFDSAGSCIDPTYGFGAAAVRRIEEMIKQGIDGSRREIAVNLGAVRRLAGNSFQNLPTSSFHRAVKHADRRVALIGEQ